jgi:hypothetical protein
MSEVGVAPNASATISRRTNRTPHAHRFIAVISRRYRLGRDTSETGRDTSETVDEHLLNRGGVQPQISEEYVASTDYKGWSPYGAPWLQTVAISRKSVGLETGENKRKPLPTVATGCGLERMVRRGSTVRVRQRTPRKGLLMQVFRRLDRQRRSIDGYQTGTRASRSTLETGRFRIYLDRAAFASTAQSRPALRSSSPFGNWRRSRAFRGSRPTRQR